VGVENAEKFEFKSEARQLLDLMIHSLYANKDVFLRELISNASDALDKRRFEALTNPELMAGDPRLEIRVWAEPDEGTLHVADSGIGMTRQEVIENLGTIARSGTREFADALEEAKKEGADADALIGQFGVGFYSSFIAADEVTVITRKAGTDEAVGFRSTGDGSYEIFDAERDDVGTTVTLHLRPADEDDHLEDFTQEWPLRRTIKKYSDFIQYPIELKTERTEKPRDDEGEVIEDAEPETRTEWVMVNSQKAIWVRDESDVEDSEYNEFYKHISRDWTEPLDVVTTHAEGMFRYHALLFVPGRAPMDLFYRDAKWGLQLYVNRVLIMEECQELLPDYLRFVKGVVDSPDLSLNVSREVLQRDRRVTSIRKRLTKKVLDQLKEMQVDDPEQYETFWNAFGRVLKEGVVSDPRNRDRLLELLWLESSETVEHDASEEADDVSPKQRWTSLRGYVERMKDGQEAIYYITGDNLEALEGSPHLEAFAQRGYEVLYLTDPYDEIMLGTLNEYEDLPLKSVGKGEVDLGDEEEREEARQELEEQEKEHEGLLKFLQSQLDEHIKEVRLTRRLTSSPACLVGEEGDYSPHFKRLLERAGSPQVPDSKRILEVNPKHPLFEKMQQRFEKDESDPVLESHAHLLFGQALLAEGSPLPDPVGFSRQLTDLLVETL